MNWKIFPLFLLTIWGMSRAESQTVVLDSNFMIPTLADIGGSAKLYCFNQDGGSENFLWWRVNLTNGETINRIYETSGPRYNITKIDLTGCKVNFGDTSFCPMLPGQNLREKNEGCHEQCTTSVLTVLNVTEDDYNTTYKCSYNERSYYAPNEWKFGQILNPERGTLDFIWTSAHKTDILGILQCAANHNTSWFMSFDNQTLTNINEPEKLPSYFISKNFYKESFAHEGSLQESLLIIDRIKIVDDIFFYCGTSVESATYVGSVSHVWQWPRYEDMWEQVREYYIWKVCYVFPPLILVASIIALTRAGVHKMCCNHCLNHAAARALIAKHGRPQGVVYLQFVNSPPSSTHHDNVSSESSVILDLVNEVTDS